MISYLFVFALGSFTTLGLLFILILVVFQFLPKAHRKYDRKPQLSHNSSDSSTDSQLYKRGWIRLSSKLLAESDIYQQPMDMPDYLLNRKESRELLKRESKTFSKLKSFIKATSFIVSKFKGEETPKQIIQPLEKQWRNLYAVLSFRNLLLYPSNSMDQVWQALFIPDFDITIDAIASELFYRDHPIVIKHKLHHEILFIYCDSASEKEEWYYKLLRAQKLPIYSDNASLSAFYHDLEPVRAYEAGIQKLMTILDANKDQNSPEWLNALLGRAFISIHSNLRIKKKIIESISRILSHSHHPESSFLGDIVIREIDVGDSIPIISNPKLLSISETGDLCIEMDLEYTGGIALELATVASISVDAWVDYVKPITVPILVRVSITKFCARVLIKMRPLWESHRIWIGLYRHPEVILELNMEPIISNKLVKLELVNQVIESRIKDALEEFLILPNMEDFAFWDSDEEDLDLGSDVPSDPDIVIVDDKEKESVSESEHEKWKMGVFENKSELSIADSLAHYHSEVLNELDISDDPSEESQTALSYVGETAFQVGKLVRDYGIDDAGKTLFNSVSSKLKAVSTPALNLLERSTRGYREYARDKAVSLGLAWVDRLGLRADDSLHPSGLHKAEENEDSAPAQLRRSESKLMDIMGVRISTVAPTESMLRKRDLNRSKSLSSLRYSASSRESSVLDHEWDFTKESDS